MQNERFFYWCNTRRWADIENTLKANNIERPEYPGWFAFPISQLRVDKATDTISIVAADAPNGRGYVNTCEDSGYVFLYMPDFNDNIFALKLMEDTQGIALQLRQLRNLGFRPLEISTHVDRMVSPQESKLIPCEYHRNPLRGSEIELEKPVAETKEEATEIEELKKELFQTKENLDKLMARLHDAETDNRKLKDDFDKVAARLLKVEVEKSDLKKDLCANIDNNGLLYDQVQRLERELKAANEDLSRNEATNKELLVQLKHLKGELKLQREENANLHEQNERQNEIIVKKNKEIRTLRQGYGDEGADKLRFLKENAEKYKTLFEQKSIEVNEWRACAERWQEAYQHVFDNTL